MMALLVLVKASLVLLLTAIALAFAGRRWSAASRHLTCTLAVAGLLMLPILSATLPGWNAIRTSLFLDDAVVSSVDAPPATAGSAARISVDTTPAMPVADDPASTAIAQTEAGMPARTTTVVPWAVLAVLVYLAGVAALTARLFAQHIAVRRMVSDATEVHGNEWTSLIDACAGQMNLRTRVRLLHSPDRAVPMVAGIRRPAILVPAGAGEWPTDARRIVLLHEFAHVARRDCLIQTAAALMCAVYWPHPGAWWLARRLRIERELACDDLVLSNGADARDYAGMLLELSYSRRVHAAPALAVGMAARRPLETRLLALVDSARNRSAPTVRTRAAAAVIGMVLMLPIAAATAVADQPAGDVPQAVDRPAYGVEPGYYRRFLTVEYWRHAADDEFRRIVDQLNYLTEMRKLGYSMTDVNALIEVRRHGVTPDYVRALSAEGLSGLTTDDLLAAISHGVEAGFIRDLRNLGLTGLSLETLIRARSHGVTPAYIRDLRAFGYQWSIDELAQARSHGIDDDYMREISSLGYQRVSLDVLTLLKSHGIEPPFIRDLQTLGYGDLSPEDLSALRSHGVTPEKIREANEAAGRRLSIEELSTLASHSWRQ